MPLTAAAIQCSVRCERQDRTIAAFIVASFTTI
jgi:hypothetical protein